MYRKKWKKRVCPTRARVNMLIFKSDFNHAAITRTIFVIGTIRTIRTTFVL